MEGGELKPRSIGVPSFPLQGVECKTGLLQNDHLCRRDIICLQLVEIDASRNPLAEFVAPIPIRCTTPIRVIPRPLMTEC